MYSTGQRIPESGTYEVVHAAHKLPREVTLLRGQIFPRCCRCPDVVTFALLALTPALDSLDFKIALYELPELADDAQEAAA